MLSILCLSASEDYSRSLDNSSWSALRYESSSHEDRMKMLDQLLQQTGQSSQTIQGERKKSAETREFIRNIREVIQATATTIESQSFLRNADFERPSVVARRVWEQEEDASCYNEFRDTIYSDWRDKDKLQSLMNGMGPKNVQKFLDEHNKPGRNKDMVNAIQGILDEQRRPQHQFSRELVDARIRERGGYDNAFSSFGSSQPHVPSCNEFNASKPFYEDYLNARLKYWGADQTASSSYDSSHLQDRPPIRSNTNVSITTEFNASKPGSRDYLNARLKERGGDQTATSSSDRSNLEDRLAYRRNKNASIPTEFNASKPVGRTLLNEGLNVRGGYEAPQPTAKKKQTYDESKAELTSLVLTLKDGNVWHEQHNYKHIPAEHIERFMQTQTFQRAGNYEKDFISGILCVNRDDRPERANQPSTLNETLANISRILRVNASDFGNQKANRLEAMTQLERELNQASIKDLAGVEFSDQFKGLCETVRNHVMERLYDFAMQTLVTKKLKGYITRRQQEGTEFQLLEVMETSGKGNNCAIYALKLALKHLVDLVIDKSLQMAIDKVDRDAILKIIQRMDWSENFKSDLSDGHLTNLNRLFSDYFLRESIEVKRNAQETFYDHFKMHESMAEVFDKNTLKAQFTFASYKRENKSVDFSDYNNSQYENYVKENTESFGRNLPSIIFAAIAKYCNLDLQLVNRFPNGGFSAPQRMYINPIGRYSNTLPITIYHNPEHYEFYQRIDKVLIDWDGNLITVRD